MENTTREERFTEFWPGDQYADVWPKHYKAGMWMWLFHRITGLIIITYGIIHLGETALASIPGTGEDVFNWFYRVVGLHPFIQFLDIIIMTCLLYHGFNGLRIVLMDFWGIGTRKHKLLFYVLMGTGGIIWVLALNHTLPYIIHRSLW
ncbi:MAG: succinate dehydrogenase, cytochrome b556 subunit [Dehalococcoidia bacterium]|nr:succinate dehydrogenase, cytochrome b556 subunit [Dehalococcoidia bacterium]MDZ4246213.1 succinate dehydrogenase, cytochrome b556 subunit [Dehalococcoidia bacterium]